MNVLETLQRIAATTERLDHALAEISRERSERERLESLVGTRVERTEGRLSELSERVVRLETSRESDRAQAGAEFARFLAEVERAEGRLRALGASPES